MELGWPCRCRCASSGAKSGSESFAKQPRYSFEFYIREFRSRVEWRNLDPLSYLARFDVINQVIDENNASGISTRDKP